MDTLAASFSSDDMGHPSRGDRCNGHQKNRPVIALLVGTRQDNKLRDVSPTPPRPRTTAQRSENRKIPADVQPRCLPVGFPASQCSIGDDRGDSTPYEMLGPPGTARDRLGLVTHSPIQTAQ